MCKQCEAIRLERDELREYKLALSTELTAYMVATENLKKQNTELQEEIEHLRVQLAGCGVTAMCNTRESIEQHSAKVGDYGYSASYQDVLNAMGREIALREENQSLRTECERLRANTVDAIGSVLECGDSYGDEFGNTVIKSLYYSSLLVECERLKEKLAITTDKYGKLALRADAVQKQHDEWCDRAERLESELAALRRGMERIAESAGPYSKNMTPYTIARESLGMGEK